MTWRLANGTKANGTKAQTLRTALKIPFCEPLNFCDWLEDGLLLGRPWEDAAAVWDIPEN